MSESMSHLIGHIPWNVGSQVTQRRPVLPDAPVPCYYFLIAGKCCPILCCVEAHQRLSLSRACCRWLAYHSGLPSIANCCPTLGRCFHCRKCCTPLSASGFGGGHPRSHCPVHLWKTQEHYRDEVRILVTHKHQFGVVHDSSTCRWRFNFISKAMAGDSSWGNELSFFHLWFEISFNVGVL